METDWDEFSKALEAKIQERILPLEQQLSDQQEIILKLSQTLQSTLELLQVTNDKKSQAKEEKRRIADAVKENGSENHDEVKKESEKEDGEHVEEEKKESEKVESNHVEEGSS